MIKIVGNKGIAEIIGIFIIVLVAGMLITIGAVSTSCASVIYETCSSQGFTVFSYVVDAIILLTLALLVIRRHKHHGNTLLFEVLEGTVTALTSFFVFLILLTMLSPNMSGHKATSTIYIASAALAIFIVLLKDKWHRLRDFNTVVSSIGVGLVLGFNLQFEYAIVLIAIFAIYDYIAVFKTKEMISMAKAFASNDISFLMSVSDLEAVPRWGLSQKEIDEYMKYLRDVHLLDNPKFRKILQKGKLPVISQISLGEGDLGLPLMAAISAYMYVSQFLSYMVMLGSVIGIAVTMLILKKYKHPIPAIPPLFAFIGIFAGIAFIITESASIYSLGVTLILIGILVMLIDMLAIVRKMHIAMRKAVAA